MKSWLRRIRGAVGMGLTWAVGWALFGVLIGITSLLLPGLLWDRFFEVFDAPLPALAVPGFVGGAFFSTVLGIAGRRRRFDELSLPRFAAWGAVGGLLLGLFPAAMVAVGSASANVDAWLFTSVIIGPLSLLSAVSASGSLVLARMTEDQALLEASEDVAEVGLTEGEAQELLSVPPQRADVKRDSRSRAGQSAAKP